LQKQLQDTQSSLRIGLHVGEIFFEDGKVMGDGVNVLPAYNPWDKQIQFFFLRRSIIKLRINNSSLQHLLGNLNLKMLMTQLKSLLYPMMAL
jgi:hypothetical protein